MRAQVPLFVLAGQLSERQHSVSAMPRWLPRAPRRAAGYVNISRNSYGDYVLTLSMRILGRP